jgi:hypothetical protein
MTSNDVHEQLILAYDEARKRHRQVLERFFPTANYSHGQRYELPAQRPSTADLEDIARLAAEEQAAHQRWMESFGYRTGSTV